VTVVDVTYLEFARLHTVADGTRLALNDLVNTIPVLIVEDDPESREMMTTVLRLSGLRSIAAANGAEALKYLRTGGDASVILLDLMMPVLDGFEFRREQLTERRLAIIPVMVLSANASARASELPGCAVFDKPVDVFEIAAIVRSLASADPPSRYGLSVC
jgi:CheY-like chemotaxis protein